MESRKKKLLENFIRKEVRKSLNESFVTIKRDLNLMSSALKLEFVANGINVKQDGAEIFLSTTQMQDFMNAYSKYKTNTYK